MYSNRLVMVRVFAIVASILLLGSAVAWAQGTGTITGRVVDKEFQAPIPAVRVALVGTTFVAYCDNDGRFTLASVPAGTYTLRFESGGFSPVELADLQVIAGQATEQNAELSLARIMEEVTVTATRGELTLKEIPQDMSVITAEQMERTTGNTTVDYLDKVSGVDASTSGAGISRGITFLQINGYGNGYIREMIDGVDISNVAENYGLIQEFPVEMIERIDIVKGGSSAAWGSGMAGVVNVVTKQPHSSRRPLLNVHTKFSTWGEMDFGDGNAVGNSGAYGKGGFDLTGTLGDEGKLGYFIYGSHLGSAGFIEHAKERNTRAGVKLNYELQPGESLNGFFNYTLSDGEMGHLYLRYPGTSLWYWNYQDDLRIETKLGTARYANQVKDNLEVSFSGKASSSDALTVRENVVDALLGPAGAINEYHSADRVYGLSGQANYFTEAGGEIVFGMDYYNKDGDFTDQGYGHLQVNEYSPYVNASEPLNDVFRVNVGLRYDDSDLFKGQLSPQAGIVANLSDDTLFRVNAGRAYQTPQLWQLTGEAFVTQVLPNPDLNPERAWLYSAGFETNEVSWLWFKASGYLHKMTDGIVTTVLPNGRFQWANEDTFTRKGVSLELGVQSRRGVFASIGYNYNKHVNTTGDEAEVLLWLPTRTWKTSVGYSNPSLGLDAYVTGKNVWYNQQGIIGDILQANDEHWLFDLKVSKEFRLGNAQSLTVHTNIYNLTDALFWERIDLPYAKRWVDVGVKLSIR